METNYGTQTSPDFDGLKTRARRMTVEALRYSAEDALEAALAAASMEAAGCPVSKTEGFYRDEASVYRTELLRREAKA